MPVINIWLREAAEQLANAGIPSALLDSEIILAHTLRKSRTYLHSHGDEEISHRELDIANARLDLRLDRTPVAYIVGHKEFYGRLFKVTPSTLIPRPESESLIELLNEYYTATMKTLVDVGTGSGCLGITAKLEHPDLSVSLTDVSRHALVVAEENAQALGADVAVFRSNLLRSIPGTFSCVIANLPYVDREWERSPETNHEPALALFADKNGVALIYELLDQAYLQLVSGGLLLLEADPYQHPRIIERAVAQGFTHLETRDYAIALIKD